MKLKILLFLAFNRIVIMKIKGFLIISLIFLVGACSKVPISGRTQMNLLPESELIVMSFAQYDEFLNTHDVVSPGNIDARKMLNAGRKIAESVHVFLKEKQMLDRVKGFEWEFNLVDDDAVNAWCMPGGKVVVYTGILPITKTETGLAVVMGHEIAHAIARHGNERMSQQILIQFGGQALDVLLSNEPDEMKALFLTSYGIAGGVGSLAFSRNQETEADKLGLVFMAMAGYDPQEAILFWERMATNGGASTPEFLSTHPSDETRINNLKAFMPEAMKYYKP